MKLKEIILLEKKINIISNKKMPVKLSFAIAKNLKQIKQCVEDYEEQRIKLIHLYAKKDQKGELIIDKNGNAEVENQTDFVKELTELLNTEEKFDIVKVNVNVLDKYDDNNNIYDPLTPIEWEAIDWMINMEE